jgi:hypothetical protein
LWTGNVDLVAARSDYWGTAAQNAGASTAPVVRGLARLDLLENAGVLKVKVTSTTPTEGDLEIALAVDAEAFGGTVVPVRLGDWTRVVLSTDGSGVGDPPSHVEILWPADTADLAVDDEWSIPFRVATPWVVSLPPVRALSEVETDIYLDGVRVVTPISSLSLNASHTAEADTGIGGVWPVGTLQGGQRQVVWQLDRRMVDNTLQRRLEAGVPLHLDVVATSPVTIGASGVPYRLRWVSPNCLLSGRRPTVTDPNTQRESYQLNAYPAPVPDAEGFVDDLTVVVDNGVAGLG